MRRRRSIALALLLLLCVAVRVEAQPVVQGVGAVVSSGAGVTIPTPVGAAVGDLGFAFCATAADQTIGIGSAQGWTELDTESTGSVLTDDVRCTIRYKIFTGTGDAPNTSDSGNHQLCRMVTVTAGTFNASSPLDVGNSNSQTTATTAISVSGATSTVANTLVFAASCGAVDPPATDTSGFASWANAALTGVAERIDNRDQVGNGSYLGVATGVKASAGAWGATTATGAESMEWANISFNVQPNPSTPTATNTRTPTNTNTPTRTPTPTAAAGCGVTVYTPVLDEDDGFVRRAGADGSEWPPTGTITLNTAATTNNFGKFVFGTTFNDVGLYRWDTSDLHAAGRGAVAAVFIPRFTSGAGIAGRNIVAEWVGAEGAWTTGDYVLDVGTTALDFATSATPNNTTQYAFTLSNVGGGVDISGHTGLRVGLSGGSGASGGGSLATEMREHAGSLPPELVVYWCANTPTPTQTGTPTATGTATATPTATGTATATATRTPTGTPTVPIGTGRCPDVNGDSECGVAILGNPRTAKLFPWAKWLMPSADMVCRMTFTNATIGNLRATAELWPEVIWGAGACEPMGTVERGSDIFADVVIVDIAAVYDYALTATAPRDGICHGPGGACVVNAPLGFAENWDAPNGKCIGGPDWRTPCVPVGFIGSGGCAGDDHPTDRFRSLCQPWVYGDGEGGVEVYGCPEGTCQQRTQIHSIYRNVEAIVQSIRERGAVPVLLFMGQPAQWQNSRNVQPVATALLPDGAPYPDGEFQAKHEVAGPDLRIIRSWMHAWHALDPTNPVAFIDLESHFERETDGRPWRALGGQTYLMDHTQFGRCTCVTDADCGAGGTCASNLYCTAGPRASCSGADDPVCRGSDSQQHPGNAWCGRDQGRVAALALNACIEDLATNREPEWETGSRPVLCCSEPCIPAPEEWTPHAPLTPTPTATVTATVTATATATDTPPPGSTATPTSDTNPTPHMPAATISASSSCWKSGVNGKLADIYGAQMRRIVSGYSACFSGKGHAIDSPSCDVAAGISDYSSVPSSITYAMRVPGEVAQISNDIGRVGFHAVEDKLQKFCTHAELQLHWDWVRYRAQQLGETIPPLEPFLTHSGTHPEWPWDAWFAMEQKHYLFKTLAMIRADISGSSLPFGGTACVGAAMNRIGFGLFDKWIAGGDVNGCTNAYSAAAVNNNCGVWKPAFSEWDVWCDRYTTLLMPLWQAYRAAEGKPCGADCP